MLALHSRSKYGHKNTAGWELNAQTIFDMERLLSVIMLILNIICFVYRCNNSIACLNWILNRFIFLMSNRDIHNRSECAPLKWSTDDSSFAVYDRNSVFDPFVTQNDHKQDSPLYWKTYSALQDGSFKHSYLYFRR